MDNEDEIAVFGGGCFWCTEAVFAELKGVTSVVPGYAGGHTDNPTYRQVCSDSTGHAEVSRVQFDPSQITFHDLLSVFFATHDPTTLNRQGADRGTHYRRESRRCGLLHGMRVATPDLVRQLRDGASAAGGVLHELRAARRRASRPAGRRVEPG